MKRWIHATENVSFIPQRLAQRPYVFILNSVNSIYNDEIFEIADHYGATRVKYQSSDSVSGNLRDDGSIWRYAVPSEKAAEYIYNEVKKRGIPVHQDSLYIDETDWTQNYNIWIDDYDKGEIKIPYNSSL